MVGGFTEGVPTMWIYTIHSCTESYSATSKSTKLYHVKIILVSNIRIDKLESKNDFDLMKTTNYFSANLYLPLNSLVLITLVIIRLKKIR